MFCGVVLAWLVGAEPRVRPVSLSSQMSGNGGPLLHRGRESEAF